MGRVRLILKKRGHRWTGSGVLGSLGEGFVLTAFLVGGSSGLLTMLASRFVSIPGLSAVGLGSTLSIVTLVVLTSMFLIGAGGLVLTFLRIGVSQERRSAIVKRAPSLRPPSEFYPPASLYPTVPRNEDLINSPGVELTHRLPMRSKPAWSVFAAAVLALMWDGLLTVFSVTFFTQWWNGLFLWYVVPVIVGLGYFAVRGSIFFVRRLQEELRVGPTHVETSQIPFLPGGTYDLALVQFGDCNLRGVRMALVCDESATFREGTEIRVERQRVFEREILRLGPTRLRLSAPLTSLASVTCDRDFMHSFQTVSNSIEWRIHVELRTADGGRIVREFALVVFPAPRTPSDRLPWNH